MEFCDDGTVKERWSHGLDCVPDVPPLTLKEVADSLPSVDDDEIDNGRRWSKADVDSGVGLARRSESGSSLMRAVDYAALLAREEPSR